MDGSLGTWTDAGRGVVVDRLLVASVHMLSEHEVAPTFFNTVVF
jgi:hypothetical protein